MFVALEPEYPTMSMAMNQSDLIRLHRDIIDQLRAELEASRTGGEVVGWQFYQDGEWCTGMETSNHKQNTIDAGYEIRNLYTAPPVVVPECTEAMTKAGADFALTVAISSHYTWPQYMKDLWSVMNEAASQPAQQESDTHAKLDIAVKALELISESNEISIRDEPKRYTLAGERANAALTKISDIDKTN